MNIIETPNLDLINPFPKGEIPRIINWIAATQSIYESDDSPKTSSDIIDHLNGYLEGTVSFGIVDRDNWLRTPQIAPIVGIVAFEPMGINAYMHFACTRKARGQRLIDQALQGSIDYMFSNYTLARISACVPVYNHVVKTIIKRVGFEKEGVLQDMLIKEGRTQPVGHFGLLKRNWQCHFGQLLEGLVGAHLVPLEDPQVSQRAQPEQSPQASVEPVTKAL